MKYIAVGLIAVIMTGCSNLNEPLDDALGGGAGGEDVQQVEIVDATEFQTVSTEGADQGERIRGEIVDGGMVSSVDNGVGNSAGMAMLGADVPAQRLFFFGFDSSAVSPEDLAVVQGHAAYLINNPVMMVRLEGHADERGSREYNLSLGERRAQTMSDLLIAEGVNNGQIEILSYGEEKPLEAGHEEAFWAQNRRVELSYPQ